MAIKLITIENDHKISLPPGDHIFGRYKLLHADDARVSRQHGQLQVNNDTVVLKSLHVNPCFYKKKGSAECVKLNRDNCVTLSNGDRFGLVPETDKLWYEVLFVPDTEDDDTEKLEEEGSENENKLQNGNDIIDENTIENDMTQKNNSTLSNISNENMEAQNSGNVSPSCLNQNEPNSNISDCNDENSTEEASSSTHLKRAHSESVKEEDAKKVKVEESSDVDKPSTSDQGNASNSKDGVDNKPAIPLRERCMYGANCYRKNPAHFAQFSHPRDADWGPGERALCPYGVACSKRDPRHWRDHDHPPGAAPPPPRPRAQPHPGAAQGRNKRNKPDSPKNVIVTGKRPRKPIQRDILSDSEPDEDPYATDESDEWKPDSGSRDFSEDYI